MAILPQSTRRCGGSKPAAAQWFDERLLVNVMDRRQPKLGSTFRCFAAGNPGIVTYRRLPGRTGYGIGAILFIFGAPVGQCASLSTTASPSAITIPANSDVSVSTTLELKNSGPDDVNLVVWQVALAVVPDAGAVGTVEIEGFGTPTDYLLTGLSPFGPVLAFGATLPNATGVFTDAAFGDPTGGLIPAGGARNILDLQISVHSGASGSFRLLVLPFDDDPSMSSSWGDASFPVPTQFDHAGPGASESERTLVTISVAAIPEPSGVSIAATGLLAALMIHARAACSSPLSGSEGRRATRPGGAAQVH
jgi:hypothetical protein